MALHQQQQHHILKTNTAKDVRLVVESRRRVTVSSQTTHGDGGPFVGSTVTVYVDGTEQTKCRFHKRWYIQTRVATEKIATF